MKTHQLIVVAVILLIGYVVGAKYPIMAQKLGM